MVFHLSQGSWNVTLNIMILHIFFFFYLINKNFKTKEEMRETLFSHVVCRSCINCPADFEKIMQYGRSTHLADV